MKTLVVYASNHGTTAEVAAIIASKIGCADIIDVSRAYEIGLGNYGCIVIGASVHAGSIQRSMRQFLKKYEEILITKVLGLFLCAMHKEAFGAQLERAFPKVLRSHARACEVLGGAFLFDKMSHFEKRTITEITGIENSVSEIDYNKIDAFVIAMQ